MVFSFFKKSEKKAPARPAALSRPGEDKGTAAGGAQDDKLKSTANRPAAGLPRADQPFVSSVSPTDAPPLELSEFVFSDVSPDYQLEVEVDPVDAEGEEAAMLYANGQDRAVCSRLENSIRNYRSGAGERLWLMLFDFFRLTGQKASFEMLEVEYAQCFEKSPPVWREASTPPTKARTAVGTVLFKGDLIGDNDSAFEVLRQAVDRNPQLRVDLAKVQRVDAAGCERLLSVLEKARKGRREVELLNRDHLAALVNTQVVSGCAEHRGCWLLKLELLQLSGQLEAFEELAIDYAVSFEISPPSWEPDRVKKDASQEDLTLAVDSEGTGEAYVIKGEVKGARFSDLLAYAAANDPVLIDCAAVTRMDFVSAGSLLNVLATVKRTGREIVFRHPNYLVAELFRVVGLNSVAQIVLPRN